MTEVVNGNRIRRFVKEWGAVTAFVVVVATVVLYFSLASASTQRAHDKVAEDIRQEIVVHGKAAASRSCSTARLMALIIFSRNDPTVPREKREVHAVVRDACRFVDPIAGG